MRRQSRVFLIYPGLLLLINILIAGKLFFVEYSGWLQSIEGAFIAMARQIASHPFDLQWWPLWDCGIPFQNTYLPLLQFVVAGFARLTHESAALSYHQVSAAFFCVAPVSLYFMAWTITRREHASFLAALAFSLFSPCAWLVPAIRADVGSPWNMRRLQILVYYGEGPHNAMLALLPLAILFLYLAVARGGLGIKVLSGALLGATVMTNAFGAVLLAIAAIAILATTRTDRFRRNLLLLGTIGLLAYIWISPLVPPSVISAIRLNSPTAGGDFRYTPKIFGSAAGLALGCLVLWVTTRRLDAGLRFFLWLALPVTGIVLLGTLAQIYIVPQPRRYQIAMDMALCLCAIFGCQALLRNTGLIRCGALALLLLACGIQFRHDLKYAHRLIRSTDITRTPQYRIARWMEANMRDRRVMISGAYSFSFNDFTDVAQLQGGFETTEPNVLLRIADFTLYSGMNTGARDAEISTLWLRAFGVSAISVPGFDSAEFYKPFVNPRKFEGVLPVLWRENGDTIYRVPARSDSLAHVIPDGAQVQHAPVMGLDVREIERYVRALDNPALPVASFEWKNRHSARIQAMVLPGEVISTQISYSPGWRARANGMDLAVQRDGLGLIMLRPACTGPCDISLYYGTSREWRFTLVASIAVMAGVLFAAVARKRQQSGTI